MYFDAIWKDNFYVIMKKLNDEEIKNIWTISTCNLGYFFNMFSGVKMDELLV